MSYDSLEKIYLQRNQSKFGNIGLYGKERGELFSGWLGTGKRVLDIGCRDGSLTQLFTQGNQIEGADIDKQALESFTKNLGGKTYYTDLNNEWPFGENEFDGIVASEFLEHLYRPEDLIKQVVKSLKSGGLFIGSVPNAFSLANRIRLFLAQPNKTALSDPTHVHHFSYQELKTVLKKYFINVKLVPLGRLNWLGKVNPGLFSFMIVFCGQKVKINN